MNGQQLKMQGLDLVEQNNTTWVERMRDVAKIQCATSLNGTVTTDNLRYWANATNDHPESPNAWGAVFRGKHWECVGRVKSGYRSNHAREIKVWRYRK